MIKVAVYEEEYYPVFELSHMIEEGETVHEVLPELYDKYKEAYKAFVDVQKQLIEMIYPGRVLPWVRDD